VRLRHSTTAFRVRDAVVLLGILLSTLATASVLTSCRNPIVNNASTTTTMTTSTGNVPQTRYRTQPGQVTQTTTATTISAPPTTTTTAPTTATTRPSTTHPAPQPKPAPVGGPPADSGATMHICYEILHSGKTPSQYRSFIQGQPDYARMTGQDRTNLDAGVRMANTGSCN
jgi:hypothetical protein